MKDCTTKEVVDKNVPVSVMSGIVLVSSRGTLIDPIRPFGIVLKA